MRTDCISHHIKTDNIEKEDRTPELIAELLRIWEASVRASHHFLTEEDIRIEMLFLHPDYFRKGIGRTLVQKALSEQGVQYVDVNEQNPSAVKFYERMGFRSFRRDGTDDQGNPFPVLRMKI